MDKLLCLNDTSRLVCNMIGYQDLDGGTTMFPGADEFFPPFLLVLIRTNPPHLVSTIEYCCQLMEGSWGAYPHLEILLGHLEACQQFVLTCTFVVPARPSLINAHDHFVPHSYSVAFAGKTVLPATRRS